MSIWLGDSIIFRYKIAIDNKTIHSFQSNDLLYIFPSQQK